MKKLIATLAVLALAPGAFAANGEFTNSAEFRVRHTTNMQDENRASNESHMDHRLLWNVDYRSGEKFSGHLGLIHNSRWGTDNGSTGGLGTQNTFNDNNTSNQNLLIVNQAYANWMVSDDSQIKAGRMPIVIADGSVMGTNDYENSPTAYSAFHFAHDTEFANIGFYAFKMYDDTAATGVGSQDPEQNNYLFNFDFKSLPEFLKMANLHILQRTSNESTGGTNNTSAVNQMRYGLTLGGDTMGADYRFTYASIGGDTGTAPTQDYSSSMIDFELGYSMPEMMNMRVSLGYHTDTGDDQTDTSTNETYDGFAYAMHENAGLMDLMTWGNLTDTNVNFTFDAAGMSWGLHYHIFAATEDLDTTDSNFALGGVNSVATESDLGTEIDLKVTHKYADNFKISALYSQFSYGERLTGTADTKDKQKLSITGTWMF